MKNIKMILIITFIMLSLNSSVAFAGDIPESILSGHVEHSGMIIGKITSYEEGKVKVIKTLRGNIQDGEVLDLQISNSYTTIKTVYDDDIIVAVLQEYNTKIYKEWFLKLIVVNIIL